MKYETLLALHRERDYRITTDGTGKSWVEVPYGDDLGGHLAPLMRMSVVDGWGVIDRPSQQMTLVPTYAWDRVVVAGLRCSAPVRVPDASEDYFQGQSQQQALRALMREHDLTGAQVGALIGVDGRTIRRWLAPDKQPGSRAIPYAAWFTLRAKVDQISASAVQ